MTRGLVVEHRRLAPRHPLPDPVALILEAAERLVNVPRESTASMPDMLFHNRRVAKQIAEAAQRLEQNWEPKGSTKRTSAVLPPARDQHREITAVKGRRVRVVERGRCRRTLELSL